MTHDRRQSRRTWLFAVMGLLVLPARAAPADANTATQAQLESITGIGPALAQRILDERARSLFADWHDMVSRVAGLGAASAAKLSAAGLTVNGAAFDASSSPKPAKRSPTR